MADFIEQANTFELSEGGSEGVSEGVSERVSEGVRGDAYSPRSSRSGPVVVLVIGMAGSGKTTLMHRINHHVKEQGKRSYFINLDPAVKRVPFAANIDIRDTVNYKEVMTQYGLGPNGGILTALNLFATKFDQVIGLLEKRADEVQEDGSSSLDYIFVDTPGQIEAFTWSAGGQIILELLGNSFPTTCLYVSDTSRCTSPSTFMSNMLYSCSVLYKSRLPMVCVFNKVDVVACEFALEWMTDFEAYLEALDSTSSAGSGEEEYMGSLNRSLSLVMDLFYRNIRSVGVSAATGQGIEQLFVKIDEAGEEFKETYLPELEKRMADKAALEEQKQAQDLERLRGDMQQERAEAEAGLSDLVQQLTVNEEEEKKKPSAI